MSNDFSKLDNNGGGSGSSGTGGINDVSIDQSSGSLSIVTSGSDFTVDLSQLSKAKFIKVYNIGQNNLNSGALISGKSGKIGDFYESIPVLLDDSSILTNLTNAQILNNDISDNIADTIRMPAGTYMIVCTLNIETSVQRANVAVLYSINGVDSEIFNASGYVRSSSGHHTASSSLVDVISMEEEFEIQMKGRREANSGQAVAASGKSSLILIKVA